ncbi:hypothetical protein VUR80DRAFT_9640 [Thermomyces stellatus]
MRFAAMRTWRAFSQAPPSMLWRRKSGHDRGLSTSSTALRCSTALTGLFTPAADSARGTPALPKLFPSCADRHRPRPSSASIAIQELFLYHCSFGLSPKPLSLCLWSCTNPTISRQTNPPPESDHHARSVRPVRVPLKMCIAPAESAKTNRKRYEVMIMLIPAEHDCRGVRGGCSGGWRGRPLFPRPWSAHLHVGAAARHVKSPPPF